MTQEVVGPLGSDLAGKPTRFGIATVEVHKKGRLFRAGEELLGPFRTGRDDTPPKTWARERYFAPAFTDMRAAYPGVRTEGRLGFLHVRIAFAGPLFEDEKQ